MFRITAQTCRSFTLAEILILAAMNVETVHLASAGRVSPAMSGNAETRSLSQSLSRVTLGKAVQL